MSIDVNISINPKEGTISLPPFSSGRLTVAQTASGGGNPGIIDVTTSEYTLSFGDVSPGLVLIYNLDNTNYVDWGVATGVYPFRLHPLAASSSKGVPALIYRQSGTIYLLANTATCKVLVLGYDA